MGHEMPITWYREYDELIKYIPEITKRQAMMIKKYWSPYWDNPREFENTDLKDIIIDWCNRHWEV